MSGAMLGNERSDASVERKARRRSFRSEDPSFAETVGKDSGLARLIPILRYVYVS